MHPGPEALSNLLDSIIPGLEKNDRRLCLFPHARHVLSDVQGSINLLRKRRNTPIEVALTPSAMLTPSMLDSLEDHLERSFGTLAGESPLLFLHDVVIDEADERLLPVPLGSGILDRETVLEAVRAHWPREKPIVVLGEALAEQTAWLAGS
jgi:hypothetical protein